MGWRETGRYIVRQVFRDNKKDKVGERRSERER